MPFIKKLFLDKHCDAIHDSGLEWNEAAEDFGKGEEPNEIGEGFDNGECNEGEWGVANLPRFTRTSRITRKERFGREWVS